jgi:hypothetical protein
VAIEKDKIMIEVEKDRTDNMRVATEAEQVGLMRCTEDSRVMLADSTLINSQTKAWYDLVRAKILTCSI